MKCKKGFISISIIYSFFIVFMLFLVLIMSTYVNNRFNFNIYKNDIKMKLIAKGTIVDEPLLPEEPSVPEEETPAPEPPLEEPLLPEPAKVYLSNFLVDEAGNETKTNPNNLPYYLKRDEYYNYRYRGANPNNYVKFNNQLWRIVGVFRGSNIGGSSSKYYVKIISKYNFAYTKFSTNPLSYSTSFRNLNIYSGLRGAYGALNRYKEFVFPAYWYLCSMNSTSSMTFQKSYELERSSKYVANYFGALSLSDYFGGSLYGNTYESSRSNNWLLDYKGWIMNYSKQSAALINRSGISWISPRESQNAYLVVYLNSDVLYNRGTGTQTDPYIIV